MKKLSYDQIHPLRWRKQRSFSKKLASLGRDVNIGQGATSEAVQHISAFIQKEYNESIMRMPVEDRPASTDLLMKEVSMACKAAAFWDGNRNVYAVDPLLFEMLVNTKSNDLPFSHLKFPLPFMYISFPDDNGLFLPGDPNQIDGVYVNHIFPEMLEITVTSRRMDGNPKGTNWPRYPESYYYFQMMIEDDDTVGSLLSRSFRQEVTRLESGKIFEIDEEQMKEAQKDYGVLLSSVQAESDKLRLDEKLEGFDSALLAALTALNVISYLCSEPDYDVEYPENTPAKLISDIKDGTPKKKRNAKSKLVEMAILPIRVLGNKLRQNVENHSDPDSSRTVSTHWRTGHFKLVAVGKGRLLREIRWIKPVLVNPSSDNDPGSVKIRPVGPNRDKSLH